MGVIPQDFEILEPIVEDGIGLSLDRQLRQGPRLTRELQRSLLHMVGVEVHITPGPDEVAHFQVTLLSHHVSQQSIAGDIERQAEEDITATLVELTRELAIRHVELEEGVAGSQRHFVQFTHVPG